MCNAHKVFSEEVRHVVGGQGGKTAYIDDATRVTKHAVWLAKSEAEKEKFATVSLDGDGVFHIAKQMDRTNQDILVKIVYTMMLVSLRSLTKIRWAQCWAAQWRIWVAKQRASALGSLQLLPMNLNDILNRATGSKTRCRVSLAYANAFHITGLLFRESIELPMYSPGEGLVFILNKSLKQQLNCVECFKLLNINDLQTITMLGE